MELKDKAKLASKFLTTRKRPNGDKFISTTDDRPEWIVDMIHNAHDSMLPDDYKYTFVSEALDIIMECDDRDSACDAAHRDISADIYTSDLTRWLHSNNTRICYCDDTLEEYPDKPENISTILQDAQTKERLEVFFYVLNFLVRYEDFTEEEK